MISLFIRNKEFHVYNKNFLNIYSVPESRQLSDFIPMFLKDFLARVPKFDEVIYSSGPGSFTTVRIMNALLKGLFISNPSLKFTGISNFLTYFKAAPLPPTTIAIPTMRGDYFTCNFKNDKIINSQISTLSDPTKFCIDSSPFFDNINLASVQYSILNTELSNQNSNYITNFLQINYGFTPEYKY